MNTKTVARVLNRAKRIIIAYDESSEIAVRIAIIFDVRMIVEI